MLSSPFLPLTIISLFEGTVWFRRVSVPAAPAFVYSTYLELSMI